MSSPLAPTLDISILLKVIESDDAMAKARLALQLAVLVKAKDTSDAERNAVVPVMLKLCVDCNRDVRKALVGGVLDYPKLHADVVFSIIADEDEIALPFLACTPALNAWHMLAILRVGDEKRQQILLMRSDITAEALSYAAKFASMETCLILFDNSAARLKAGDYQAIYERFGDHAEVAELLLTRADLPLDIRITQAKRAASRMRTLMTERGWVAVREANELVEDAEETAILRILVEAPQTDLARAIPFLVTNKLLTPSLIVRSAVLGELRVVHWALSHLSGVNRVRAHDMMFGRKPNGIKSLAAKSGLPSSCEGVLQAACDVNREAQNSEVPLDPESFGKRLIEALMTRYEDMSTLDRSRNLELMGRYGEMKVRSIATRLRADMVRTASAA